MVARSYDGAAPMIEQVESLQAKVRETFTTALLFHCSVYKLELFSSNESH